MSEPTTPETLTPEILQGNLKQQGAGDSVISVKNNTLEINKPGIAIEDVAAFFLNTLCEIPELQALLPPSLPTGGARLSHFRFTPASADTPYLVDGTLIWAELEWAIIPASCPSVIRKSKLASMAVGPLATWPET